MMHWNRCDVCHRFIAMADFESGAARRALVTPDSDYSRESYETLCQEHNDRPCVATQSVLATAWGLIPIREAGEP